MSPQAWRSLGALALVVLAVAITWAWATPVLALLVLAAAAGLVALLGPPEQPPPGQRWNGRPSQWPR